ncbi:hypothetical protein B0H34DRAFT_270310 [Crassisporium funariophilum]|nr:hypothetical protein B0H34DRAFT_270310 [Crassisporium funariophilum]
MSQGNVNAAPTSSARLEKEKENAPLFEGRVMALSLAWCWGVIGAAVGLNALIKSNKQIDAAKHAIPAPTVITIDTRDVSIPGILSSTASLLIVLFTTLFLSMTLARPKSFRTTFVLQGVLLATCALWLFVVLVPMTLFYARRAARVQAFLDGVQLPDGVVLTVQKALGFTSVYRNIPYLSFATILPWFTFLFTSIAAIALFKAASHVDRLQRDFESNTNTPRTGGARTAGHEHEHDLLRPETPKNAMSEKSPEMSGSPESSRGDQSPASQVHSAKM